MKYLYVFHKAIYEPEGSPNCIFMAGEAFQSDKEPSDKYLKLVERGYLDIYFKSNSHRFEQLKPDSLSGTDEIPILEKYLE